MKFATLLPLVFLATVVGIRGVNGTNLASIVKEPLKIGAFNIQIFGVTKVGKEEVVEQLVEIIKRYDILFIEEIRDSSEKAIYELLDRVNSASLSSDKYAITVSERLGRSSSKEQYAYMYKPSKVSVTDEYVFNDNKGDIFEREPYVVRFASSVTSISDFAMIGVHIKPSDAINEINSLELVYDDLLKRYENQLKDVIFAGDFNADCSYVGTTKWDQVTFRTDERFLWLIDDDLDTTVALNDCAYDRFVIAGEGMARAYVPGSADVFYFDSALGLNHETAEDVSDHYPIEMHLLPPLPGCQERKILDKLDDLLAEFEREEELELLMKMINK